MANTFLDMVADSLVPVLSGTHSIYLRPYAYKQDILTTELSDQLNIASY